MKDDMHTVEYCPAYLLKGDDSDEAWFIEESAIIELLAADVLFANSRRFLDLDGTPQVETLVLFVKCNDLFAWACADAEPVTMRELEAVYRAWKSHAEVGVEQWACQKRGMRPQPCIEQEWRREGHWTAEMEALPARGKPYASHLRAPEADE